MTAHEIQLPNENIDEDFTVKIFAYQDNESTYTMNFYLFEITAKSLDGKFLYGDMQTTSESLDDRQEDIHLFIKWDGCSHIMLSDNKSNCMYHLCGGDDIERFIKAIRWCWEKAKSVMGELG